MGFEETKTKATTVPGVERRTDMFRREEVEKTLGAAKPILTAYINGRISREMVENLFLKLIDDVDKDIEASRK